MRVGFFVGFLGGIGSFRCCIPVSIMAASPSIRLRAICLSNVESDRILKGEFRSMIPRKLAT